MSETNPKKTRKKKADNSVPIINPASIDEVADELADIEPVLEAESNTQSDTSSTDDDVALEAESNTTQSQTLNTVIVTNNTPMDLFEAYSGTLLPFGQAVEITLDDDGVVLGNLKFLQEAHGNVAIERKEQ